MFIYLSTDYLPFAAIIGAIIGSFLTVCVYRVPHIGAPKEGEPVEDEPGLEHLPPLPREKLFQGKPISLIHPARSYCPRCEKQLLWWHNIPVVSWLILGGRCGFCKASIPVRYPLIELVTGFFAWCTFLTFPIPTAIALFLCICSLIVLSWIDLELYILPNTITYSFTFLGLLLAAVNTVYPLFTAPMATSITSSLIGVIIGAGGLWAIGSGYAKLRGKVGLGFGDVKLIAFVGAWFGLQGAYATLFLGSLIGAVLGIIWLLANRKGLSNHLPFGPSLALGVVLYIFQDSMPPLIKAIASLGLVLP